MMDAFVDFLEEVFEIFLVPLSIGIGSEQHSLHLPNRRSTGGPIVEDMVRVPFIHPRDFVALIAAIATPAGSGRCTKADAYAFGLRLGHRTFALCSPMKGAAEFGMSGTRPRKPRSCRAGRSSETDPATGKESGRWTSRALPQ